MLDFLPDGGNMRIGLEAWTLWEIWGWDNRPGHCEAGWNKDGRRHCEGNIHCQQTPSPSNLIIPLKISPQYHNNLLFPLSLNHIHIVKIINWRPNLSQFPIYHFLFYLQLAQCPSTPQDPIFASFSAWKKFNLETDSNLARNTLQGQLSLTGVRAFPKWNFNLCNLFFSSLFLLSLFWFFYSGVSCIHKHSTVSTG